MLDNNPNRDYYECHVTLDSQHKAKVEVIAASVGFKVSALKGDEFLGDDVKIYCTSHARDKETMVQKLTNLTAALNEARVPYIRRKIEHIIFDERVATK